MYRCICGAEFEYPDITEDFTSEYFGDTIHHMKSVCPICGGDEFDEMDTCDICGEYIPCGEGICDCCHDFISGCAKNIRRKLRERSAVHRWNYAELLEHLIDELEE